jgi:hypothetical protein
LRSVEPAHSPRATLTQRRSQVRARGPASNLRVTLRSSRFRTALFQIRRTTLVLCLEGSFAWADVSEGSREIVNELFQKPYRSRARLGTGISE